MVNSANGNPLLCDAIVQRQPESAWLLLELARRHDRFVILETGCCRTLDWAMSNRAEVVAKYVLDCVVKEELPMEVSCCILTNYLFPLIAKFPCLMKNYIKNDSFSFEYARFSVPRSLIDTNGKRAIAMTADEPPERFRGLTAETARDFWIEHCKEHSEDLKESTDFQIEMSAKFFCIKDPTVSTKGNCRKERLCVCLYRQDFPVEVFESETLKNLVGWWFHYHRHTYYFVIILEGTGTLAFTIFSQLYRCRDEVGAKRWPLSMGLLLISCVMHGLSTLYDPTFTRQETTHDVDLPVNLLDGWIQVLHCVHGDCAGCAVDTDLCGGSLLQLHGSSDICLLYSAVFLGTSQSHASECLLSVILHVLQLACESTVFERLGPFVSMVHSAIEDSWHLLLLVAVMVFGYSVAFVALLNSGSIKDDDGNFSSLPRTMETLFYSCIGNFEVDVRPFPLSLLSPKCCDCRSDADVPILE